MDWNPAADIAFNLSSRGVLGVPPNADAKDAGIWSREERGIEGLYMFKILQSQLRTRELLKVGTPKGSAKHFSAPRFQ